MLQAVNQHRQRLGLPTYPRNENGFSPLAQISQLVAEFEYPRITLPPWFHFTRPHHYASGRQPIAFPFERLTGQPLIYASMGTLQNGQDWIFQTIAQACEGLPVQLVLSLGNPKSYASQDFPAEALVVPHAPQLELLQRATLTIDHPRWIEYYPRILDLWRANGCYSYYQRSAKGCRSHCLVGCWRDNSFVAPERNPFTICHSTGADARYLQR